jgi:Transposase DDE domain
MPCASSDRREPDHHRRVLEACLEVRSPCHPARAPRSRTRAGLAGRPPGPPAATARQAKAAPATVAGGPPGRRRRGDVEVASLLDRGFRGMAKTRQHWHAPVGDAAPSTGSAQSGGPTTACRRGCARWPSLSRFLVLRSPTGAHLAWLDQQGFRLMLTTQVPTAPGGRFAKDQFRIDLQAQTVTCPARVTVAIIPAGRGGGGRARFGPACSVCPLRSACTSSVRGWVVAIHPHEAELTAARARQRDPSWRADDRATRPKVERKLAHLLRRRHGGRRARVRGLVRVGQDFKLLAAAVNLARFATLGLCSTADGWQVQPA